MESTYRRAGSPDMSRIAELRWASIVGEKKAEPELDFGEFLEQFGAWSLRRSDTHLPFVASTDGTIVGTAWLAVQDRVPSPRAVQRASADIQGVFVLPELRGRGIGRGLLNHVLKEATSLGIERVTVHSSERAVSAYRQVGFQSSALLRHVEL